MSLSAHKLGGPQGAGALIRRGDIHIGEPLIKGGGQERGQRAGTENVAAIAGFGAAAAVAANGSRRPPQWLQCATAWKPAIKAAVPQAVIFGEGAPRLPNTTLFAVPGLKAETAIIAFDLNGIAVSSGSACSSGKVQASARAGGHGGGTRAGAGRGARQPRLDNDRTRYRKSAQCFD